MGGPWLAVALLLLALPVAALPLAPASLEPGPDASATAAGPTSRAFGLGRQDGPPGEKTLEFVCPEPANGAAALQTLQMNVVYGCPIRIYDNTIGGNQGWLFGNIRLHVNPADPSQVAFFTLHGGATRDGATNQSRDGLTHSTFSSPDMGIGWTDSWTPGFYPDESARGEWASGTMDEDGNLYILFQWSGSDTADGGDLIRLYRGDTVADAPFFDLYEDEGDDVLARDPTHIITEPQLVYVAPAEPPEVEDTNATAEERGEVGEATLNATGPAHVVLTWHEAAPEPGKSPTRMSGWIDFGWTDTGSGGGEEDDRSDSEAWSLIDDSQLIGPCRDASDPVAWDGRVYIACVADKGYDARARAKVGDVDLWSFDPATGNTTFVSHARINGDHPRLAVTPDGYFAVVTSRRTGEQAVEVHASFGWYGRHWQPLVQDLGPTLHAAMGGQPLRSAHVTAAALSEDQKTLFIVYKEWNRLEPGAPPVPSAPPSDPTDAVPRLNDYRKVIVSLSECAAPIAGAELVLGMSPDVYQREGFNANPGAFDDLQDGLQAVRMPTGEEWVFFAVSDYGAALYGAVRAASGASDAVCAIVAPPVPPPPAAVPQAVSLSTGTANLAGAVLGVISVAMVTYLLASKRRSLVRSTARSKK